MRMSKTEILTKKQRKEFCQGIAQFKAHKCTQTNNYLLDQLYESIGFPSGKGFKYTDYSVIPEELIV